MSTNLIEDGDNLGFYLTRFFGGSLRGVCYQIGTPDGCYVALTRDQMWELVKIMRRELKGGKNAKGNTKSPGAQES